MKLTKLLSLALAVMLAFSALVLTSCSEDDVYNVGVVQLVQHPALDAATEGFEAALKDALGDKVKVDVQNAAGSPDTCATIVSTFVTKNVDLIMANATPALLAAANGTTTIPVLGTSVTDYADTFAGNIPANVTGTSDAVPFDEQAKMMIDTIGLVEGDKVGVIYCTNESNSLIQYNAVKALFEAEGIVVEAYTFSETTELQAVVNTAASNSRAIYVPSDNTVAQNDTIVGNICNEMNVPVFTSYGGTICYASLAIDYYELGAKTGEMAAEILLGTKAVEDIEVATLTPSVVYNEELCAALGIAVPETK